MCEAMPLKQSELLQFEGNKEKYELLQFEGNHTLHRLAHGDEKILICFTQQKGAWNTTYNCYRGTEEQP